MAKRVAMIHGGASGMGLATVKALVKQGWNVAVVDFNSEKGQAVAAELGDAVLFVKTNVAIYEDQANAFRQTWSRWSRLDLVWANAGITDRTDFYHPQEEVEHGGPPPPDFLVVKVCFDAPVYTAYLALHYFRKDQTKISKLIFTASQAALYPLPEMPVYAAAKAGVVAFARALGLRTKELGEPITVNVICPGLVPTALNDGNPVMNVTPKEFLTPQATIVKAVQKIIDDDALTAQVFEACVDDVVAREGLPYLSPAAEFIGAGKYKDLMKHSGATAEFSAIQGRSLQSMEV